MANRDLFSMTPFEFVLLFSLHSRSLLNRFNWVHQYIPHHPQGYSPMVFLLFCFYRNTFAWLLQYTFLWQHFFFGCFCVIWLVAPVLLTVASNCTIRTQGTSSWRKCCNCQQTAESRISPEFNNSENTFRGQPRCKEYIWHRKKVHT